MIKFNENVLSEDLSPYLKQHKDNPVNWQIWSNETLQFAKKNSKPILLSIGYASCHWCHVMAHESFEDNETAEIMNKLFVNIKVSTPALPIKYLLKFELNFSKIIFLVISGIPFVPPVAKLINSLLIFNLQISLVFKSKILEPKFSNELMYFLIIG